MLHFYSPDNVSISFNGVNVVGFQDGTFIEVELAEDEYTLHKGSLGDGTRTSNLNKSGKVTITLMMEAPSNDALAAIIQSDNSSGAGVGAFQMTDVNSNVLVHADQAWIMKRPKIERAKEGSTSTVWQIQCDTLEVVAGGNKTGL